MLDWLRERPEHTRCSVLLQQIMEWTGKCHKEDMRALVKAQSIRLNARDHATVEKLRQAVRRYFKEKVAQEKGRLACFQLATAPDTSEHSHSLAREAEHVLNVAEVVDLRTLSEFRRQKKADMPDHLQEAIKHLVGGYKASQKNFRHITKLLGMSMQTMVQYPGADKKNRASKRVRLIDDLCMTMLRNTCFRQVRAWATIRPALQDTSLNTPQTTLELANMLRDPISNMRCPFGSDFEEQDRTGIRRTIMEPQALFTSFVANQV